MEMVWTISYVASFPQDDLRHVLRIRELLVCSLFFLENKFRCQGGVCVSVQNNHKISTTLSR